MQTPRSQDTATHPQRAAPKSEAGRAALSIAVAAPGTAASRRMIITRVLAEEPPDGRFARSLGVFYACLPLAAAFEVGAALAAASTGNPGVGNWAALAVTGILLIGSFFIAYTLIAMYWENSARIDGDQAYDLAVRLLLIGVPAAIAGGYFLAGDLPGAWTHIDDVLWHLFIWRTP